MSRRPSNSDLAYRGLALWLRWRERSTDAAKRLRGSGVGQGQAVLDYGCGIGSYSIPAAEIVGDGGVVYALDIHRLATESVEKRARRSGRTNVKTITSDQDTGLPDGSIDVVLLYDVLHAIEDQDALLGELYRVLKPGGTVSVLPDHMTAEEVARVFTSGGRFVADGQTGDTLEYRRAGAERGG